MIVKLIKTEIMQDDLANDIFYTVKGGLFIHRNEREKGDTYCNKLLKDKSFVHDELGDYIEFHSDDGWMRLRINYFFDKSKKVEERRPDFYVYLINDVGKTIERLV